MFHRIGRPDRIGIQPSPGQARPAARGSDFSSILAREMTGIKFSSHAENRLQTRGIKLGPAELKRLEQAVDMAAAKGARESLILVDDVALVVSVANRTVITALDREQARANVFTNIDSAVIT